MGGRGGEGEGEARVKGREEAASVKGGGIVRVRLRWGRGPSCRE